MAQVQHGFDTTDFGQGGWQEVCRALGITYSGAGATPYESHDWRTLSGLTIRTSSNPDLTDGHAGYIGVEGPFEAVAQFVCLVRELGDCKGESEDARDFI